MTARPLAPEADLAHVLDLAKIALRTGTMIDPEALLCDLLGLDEQQLQEWLDQADDFPRLAWEPDPNLQPRATLVDWCRRCGKTPCAPGHDCTPTNGAPVAPDQSRPASTRARDTWRVAEAGTLLHLVETGRPLCGSHDAGPWRAVAGATRCAECVDLDEVLTRHG